MERFYMRYSIRLLTTILATVSLAACTDIVPENGKANGEGTLAAVKVAQSVSRSVPPNQYFNENTKYCLWAYQNNGGANGNYLFLQEHGNGEIGTETASHFIDMDGDSNAKLRGDVNIFGFTDGTATAPVPDEGSTIDNPTFTIRYNGSETPDAGSVENYIYPDYMRAMSNHNSNSANAYTVLEFRHVMSQISVQVIQQDKEGNVPTARYDLRVKDIAVKGVYDEAVYDVVSDQMTIDYSGGEKTYPIWKSTKTEGDDIGITASELVRTIIMPTIDESVQKGITLELTIEGDDAGQFLGNGATSGKIEVPVLDNTTDQPLVFKPNFRYILQMAFIGGEVRVVTLVPEVYPWFDGETSSNDGDEYYQEKDLGNTALFDDLLWSTLNLGAEMSNPRTSADFEKSIGFFYQFDRNIPYFPQTDANGNIIGDIYISDESIASPNVYPVVLKRNGERLDLSSSNYAPNSISNSRYIYDLKDLYEQLEDQYSNWNTDGYSIAYGKNWENSKRLWNEIKNQPPPPGWRMPTKSDFLTIMPSTPHAGNITFLNNLTYASAGNIGSRNSGILRSNNQDIDVIYIHVPNNSDYPNYPDNSVYVNNSHPEGSNVLKNTDGDPSTGYESEYVISKRNGAKDFVGKPNIELYPGGDAQWGCIYGIKKVGTPEAYRVRWHIENLDSSKNKYVLVVSRYSATATDRLLYSLNDRNDPHYYMNYDWSHPNTVLYFPIVGLVGDGAWKPGQIANVGVETILATSEKEGGDYATLRIKIGGAGRMNQYIHISKDRDATGAQIRCVRDFNVSRNR